MTDPNEGANLSSCKTCHTTATSFDINGVQTEVQGLMDSLATILAGKNLILINSDGTYSTKSGKKSADDAGSIYNLQTAKEDKSLGVHNPSYIRALLKNSIQHMNAK